MCCGDIRERDLTPWWGDIRSADVTLSFASEQEALDFLAANPSQLPKGLRDAHQTLKLRKFLEESR
jgi:hypothetical protein